MPIHGADLAAAPVAAQPDSFPRIHDREHKTSGDRHSPPSVTPRIASFPNHARATESQEQNAHLSCVRCRLRQCWSPHQEAGVALGSKGNRSSGSRWIALIALVGTAALIAAAAPQPSAAEETVAPGPTPTPTPTSCGDVKWEQIDTDDPQSGHVLHGVAVRSRDKTWAAGVDYGGSWEKTLVRRWNGNGWRRERTPTVRGQSTILNDINAGRKGALMAVGSQSHSVSRTFVIKRKRGGWRRMDSADPSSSLNSLDHVSVLSHRRAWAVGTRWDAAGNHLVLIERWNGTRWRVAPVAMNGLLHGIHARRWNDIWAVGRTVRNGRLRTLTLHFNGRRWRHIPSPNLNDQPHILNAVHGASRNDAWAVGYHYGDVPIAMHWDGTRWRFSSLPGFGRGSNADLRGVSAYDGRAIAVGYVSTRQEGYEALVLEWDRTAWIQHDMDPFPDSTYLEDVEHAPNGKVFAAGYRSTRGGSEVVLTRPPC